MNASSEASCSVSVLMESAFSSASPQLISSPRFTLSASSLSLPAGGSGTVTATFNGGQAIGTGFFFGDVVAACGATTLRAPWFVAIQRGNGALNGNQNSPALFGLDPSVYMDTRLMSGGPFGS